MHSNISLWCVSSNELTATPPADIYTVIEPSENVGSLRHVAHDVPLSNTQCVCTQINTKIRKHTYTRV